MATPAWCNVRFEKRANSDRVIDWCRMVSEARVHRVLVLMPRINRHEALML